MEFPFLDKQTDLGTLSDPKIPVSVKTPLGFEPFLFLLDTGADFTMLPASFARLMGLPLSTMKKTKSYGIEGGGVSVYVGKIHLKIGQIPFEVTALFSSHERTPLILGRQGFFDRFNIEFDNRKRVIRVKPL